MKAMRVLAVAVLAAVAGCASNVEDGGTRAGVAPAGVRAKYAGAEYSKATVGPLMRRVADYQVGLIKSGGKKDPNWVRATFYTGVMATQRVTGDRKYADEAARYCEEEAGWRVTGGPATRPAQGWRHADRQVIGQTYTELHMVDPGAEGPKKGIQSLKDVYAEVEASGVTGRAEWWWCDALFMAPPTMTRLSAVTKDDRYLRLMDRLYWDSTAFLYDKDEHLYYRDKNFFDKRTKNGKKIFWSRGNGWVFAGLTRVMDYLPKDWPTRAKYEGLFKEMAGKLVTLQGEDGMWRSSLLDAAEMPNQETSGTAFYVTGFAWGIRNGLLDEATYGPAVRKGWAGLLKVVNEEGRVGWVQRVGAAPYPTSAEQTYEYGVGGWLLAAEQVVKLSGR